MYLMFPIRAAEKILAALSFGKFKTTTKSQFLKCLLINSTLKIVLFPRHLTSLPEIYRRSIMKITERIFGLLQKIAF
ncbi:MAG: hypothetical protein CVU92_00705 [Firmicutes bacterium HGW-Firmicutes-17]|nr:MAG: hypothetical protein CVU92_00705 [Firmicutes bacterium HGW-Firmicutes-17]